MKAGELMMVDGVSSSVEDAGMRMFLDLPDTVPLVRVWGMDPEPDRIRIFPFSHKGFERTEIMLANKILTQNFSKK